MVSDMLNSISDALETFADKFEYLYVGSGTRNEVNSPKDYDVIIVPKEDATKREYEQVLRIVRRKTSTGENIDAYIMPEFYTVSTYTENVPTTIYSLDKSDNLKKLNKRLVKPKHIKIGLPYPKQINWMRIA